MPFVSTSDPYDQKAMLRARERARKQRVRIRTAGDGSYTTKSKSDPEQYYSLHVDPDGSVRCSCVGYGYRGLCYHSAALLMYLERKQKEFDRL